MIESNKECLHFLRYSLFLLLFTQIIIGQNQNYNNHFRNSFPKVMHNKAISAPGYCESVGGSTTFEKISSVNVIEKQGNRLDITVTVFILNPTNCVSGEPCGVYDVSPEYVNVWIDWDGDYQWEAHELVLNEALTGYQSIGYDGTMIAKKSVLIPPNAKKPTWLRANLGWGSDPQNPCQLNWSFGNVVDQQVLWNMKVKEISAEMNIPIPEVSTKLLSAEYDQFGNLLGTTGDGIVAAGMKQSSFKLPVKLISFPSNIGDNSKTECKWFIKNTNLKSSGIIIGKSGKLNISVPQKVGFYELHLRFYFKNELNNIIGEQLVVLNLWVPYDIPKIALGKKIWLQRAIEWADGAINDDETALKMMQAIHGKSNWRYINGGNSWFKLVEGIEDWGNCRNMANVWTKMLYVIGVGGVEPVGHSGRNNKGFLSPAGFVAFGKLNSSNGNAYPGLFWGYDRWAFASHWFGKKGNTFYDPVFSITGTDLYFHVEYDIESVSGNTEYAGAATLYKKGSSFEFDHGNWPKYSYSISSGLNKINNISAGEVEFTGSFTEVTIDADNDGIFEQLGAFVGVDVKTEGTYNVIGNLSKDGSFITGRSLFTDPANWSESLSPQTGESQINPLFAGEEIFKNSVDGPYSISLFILDTNGTIIDADTFYTTNYSYINFGEYPARINDITELAVDYNNDSYFDEFLIQVNVQNSLADSFTVNISFTNNDKTLISESYKRLIPKGSITLDFTLDTKSLSIVELIGTSNLSVQVINLAGDNIASAEIVTSEYVSSQFEPSVISFTGENYNSGIDINSDGIFDTLQVIMGIESNSEGIFTTLAWLRDENDEDVSWTAVTAEYTIGIQNIDLKFPGEDINKSKLNGPYKIGYAVIRDSSDILYSGNDLYITDSYDYNKFIETRSELITSTGIYSESLIDSDLDNLTDTLIVALNVIPRDSGNVVALGRLTDSKNETILWASTIEFLSANEPQNLHLKFDGRYIFGNQMNGPYYLKDLQIYHVGDPSQAIEISDPFTTSTYDFNSFEPSAVITGSVKDVTMELIPNVFLIIEEVDNDYTNAEGLYNIVAVDSGSYMLKIEGPDSLDLDWSIYVDGVLNSNGDSVLVPAEIGRITRVDFIAPTDITDVDLIITESEIPNFYSLSQNFPNPFNPTTSITYSIPENSNVKLDIYNILGKKILTLVDKYQSIGKYTVEFDAAELTSGIYLYKIKTQNFESAKKMIFLK